MHTLMVVIDNCYPCNAQVVEPKGVKFLEYPEPLTADDVDQDKWSRKDLSDWDFVGYKSVPVFRMKESAAVRFAAGDDE